MCDPRKELENATNSISGALGTDGSGGGLLGSDLGKVAALGAGAYFGMPYLSSALGGGAAAAAGEGTIGSLLGASGMGALDAGGIGLGAGAAGGTLNALSQYATPLAILGSSALGANAANQAAGAQADAANRAAALQGTAQQQQLAWQKEQFDRQVALQEPWRQAGMQSLNRLSAGLQPGGEFGQAPKFQFGAAEFAANRNPGQSFDFAQQMQALDRRFAGRGSLLSGAAAKANAFAGKQMESQEYQNAFNRALTGYNANQQGQNTMFNRLAGVADTGPTSSQQIGAAGQNMANNMGNAASNYANQAGEAMMGGANARASGYAGGANALNSGLGQFMNYNQQMNQNSQQQQWLNQLSRQNGGGSIGNSFAPMEVSQMDMPNYGLTPR